MLESDIRSSPDRRRLPLTIGPAFVAAIAYVDPGNFATNFAAGARHGFLLVWVVVAANLAAMPVQYLSAKLGLATSRTLPELCRERFPAPVTWALWVVAELVTMATELAELLGTALALNLLLGLDLFPAGVAGAMVSFAVLAVTGRGPRPFEAAVGGMLVLIVAGFGYQALTAGLRPADVVAGLVPRLAGGDSLLLAVGIVGATVMPHAVYVHSSLTVGCAEGVAPRTALRATRLDVVTALGLAGVVNLTMLAVAALALGGEAAQDATLQDVHAGLGRTLGGGAALAFAVALGVSGVSSSSVGAYAGQVVMNGFTGWHVPLAVRRLVTMVPALAVLAAGTDPTQALVVSQVVLSFGIPFALVPLLLLTARGTVMGPMVNRPATTAGVATVTALITGLNVVLLAGAGG